MARARGANAVMAAAFESVYGTAPGSGYFKLPFVSAELGDEQNLIASDLLGLGREPLPPSRDVVNNSGDVVVPVDLRNFGRWLKLLLAAPTTAQGVAASGHFDFSAQPTTGSSITIGGASWTFVTSGPTGDQSVIGATLRETLANAVAGLNASATTALASESYTLNLAGTRIIVMHDTVGTGGNSITLAASTTPASNATASGSTLSGGSATGPYNHVFTSGALTLPSMAVEIGLPDVPSYGLNTGVRADSMKIQMQRSGLLSATMSLIAQGETRAGSSSAGSPSEAVIERFSQFQGEVRRNGAPLGNIVSAEITYSNSLDKVEVLRPDGRIEDAEPANVAVTGNIVVRFADTVLLDQAVNGSAAEISFGWNISAAKALTFALHEVYLPKPKLSVDGPGGIQATFNFQAAKKSGLNRTMTATLINDVAAY
jgi:hypothetical protein